ncbi:hypothetical protein FH972_023330 [Carpinus fangiana]|uniref:Uncharacterized protein n=1 Tax=Carpinus fangiana TaxID=176857 RepID=A0A5N6KUX0_9ROSI|nr:hypothetical protein FH972_023330 [Carpinus fangiana]
MSQPAKGKTPIKSADDKENRPVAARSKQTADTPVRRSVASTTPRPTSRATGAIASSTPRPASRATGATASSARSSTPRLAATTSSTPSRTTTTRKSDDVKRTNTTTASRPSSITSKPATGGLMGSKYAADESSTAAKSKAPASTKTSLRSAPAPKMSAATLKRLSGASSATSPTDKNDGRSTPTRARADSKSSAVSSAPRTSPPSTSSPIQPSPTIIAKSPSTPSQDEPDTPVDQVDNKLADDQPVLEPATPEILGSPALDRTQSPVLRPANSAERPAPALKTAEGTFDGAKLKRVHAKYVVDAAIREGKCAVSRDECHSEIRQHINEYAQSLMTEGKIESCHIEQLGLDGGLEVVVTGESTAPDPSRDQNGDADHQIQLLQEDLDSKTTEIEEATISRRELQAALDKAQAELDDLHATKQEVQKYKEQAVEKDNLLSEAQAARAAAAAESTELRSSSEELQKLKEQLAAELDGLRSASEDLDKMEEQLAEKNKLLHKAEAAHAAAVTEAESTANEKKHLETENYSLHQQAKEMQPQLEQLRSELTKHKDEAAQVPGLMSELEMAKKILKQIEGSREQALEALEKELEAMRKSVKASEQRADNEAGFRTLHERETEQQLKSQRVDLEKLRAALNAAEKRAEDEANARNEVEERGDKALQEQRRELADQCVKLNKELEARKQAFQKLEEFFRADEEKIPELEAKIVDLEQNNAALRDAQNDDEAKIKELEAELLTTRTTGDTHSSRVVELETALKNAQEADDANATLNKQLEELEASLAKAKSDSTTHEAKSKQLAAQVDRLVGDRKNIQFERDQFEEDKDRIERKLTDITSALSLSYGQGMTRLNESGFDSKAMLDQSRVHSRSSSETGFSLLEEINRSRAILDAFSRFNPTDETPAADGQLQALLDMGLPVPPSSIEDPFIPVHWKTDVSKHLESHLTSLRDELDKVMKYMNLDKNHFLHEWHIAETFGHLQVERLQRVSDNYMALVDAVVDKFSSTSPGVPNWAAQEQQGRHYSRSSSHSTTREGSVESVVFSNSGSPLTTVAEHNDMHKTPSVERLLDAQRMTDASLLALANKVRSIRSFHENRHSGS